MTQHKDRFGKTRSTHRSEYAGAGRWIHTNTAQTIRLPLKFSEYNTSIAQTIRHFHRGKQLAIMAILLTLYFNISINCNFLHYLELV